MKVCLVEAELFHSDGQTYRQTDGRTDRCRDMTKLIVAFRHFPNAPKKIKDKTGVETAGSRTFWIHIRFYAANRNTIKHTSLNENYVVPCICLRAI